MVTIPSRRGTSGRFSLALRRVAWAQGLWPILGPMIAVLSPAVHESIRLSIIEGAERWRTPGLGESLTRDSRIAVLFRPSRGRRFPLGPPTLLGRSPSSRWL